MKKLYISQPIVGKTEKEIFEERKKAIAKAKKLLGEEVEVIDTFSDVEMTPLECLGHSITCLSKADVVYFVKGWQDFRGCIVERTCAIYYDIPMIFEGEKI